MHKKRFNLPPLAFIQGFEASARHLSFTKAADELLLTQSAVSRQIRGLEDHLGVALFERRPRALELTSHGRILQGAASELLARLQDVVDRLRTEGDTATLTVTTTSGFASLWLIPRLQRFTSLQPEVDVRISATYKVVNLERALVDVAIRYAAPDNAPEGAIRLFGEELFPVCCPSLLAGNARPLRSIADLGGHKLLHMDEASGYMDWVQWLAAHGAEGLKPAASLRFDSYDQMIQAALGGQGVALGIGRLVATLLETGRLVAPLGREAVGDRAYYIVTSAETAERPHVRAFVDWLVQEAAATEPATPVRAGAAAAVRSRPQAARSGGARRRARSAR